MADNENQWGKWFPYETAPAGSYACLVSQRSSGGWDKPILQWMPATGRTQLAKGCAIMPFLMPGDPLAGLAG